jgi:hypothetical protein
MFPMFDQNLFETSSSFSADSAEGVYVCHIYHVPQLVDLDRVTIHIQHQYLVLATIESTDLYRQKFQFSIPNRHEVSASLMDGSPPAPR